MIKDLQKRLENAENEISSIGNIENSILSPIPQRKVVEEELSINLTPVNKNNYHKSRNSSVDTFINRSVDVSTRIKNRRAGAAIGDLVTKLRSSRKIRGNN